ncbi:MAG: signal peptidase I [Planctomycetota bacterium]
MSSPATAAERPPAGAPATNWVVRRLRAAAAEAWRSRGRVARRALRWAEHCFAALGGLLLAYHVLFDISVVTSGSMAPTLVGSGPDDGDWVLTEKLTFRLRGPRRWEVVTFHMNDGMQVMKRVVGLPGETVGLEVELDAHGKPVRGTEAIAVLVDGRRVERPPCLEGVRYFALGRLFAGRTVEAGDGHVVLGDDSRDSWDSRWEPPVAGDEIVGRAWLRVWPPSRIGLVNP